MSLKEKLKDHVVEQLQGLKKKPSSSGFAICCPYHHEKTPSCGVIINHQTYWPGTFHCFGCGVKGGWNDLAEKLRLKEFKFDKKEQAEDDPFYSLSNAFTPPRDTELKIELPKGIKPWTVQDGEWRGLSGKFLKDYGVYKWWCDQDSVYRLLIPAWQNGKLNGYVGARLDTVTDPKYRNAAGTWAKKTWLGYDYERNYAMNKAWKAFDYKSVALVEGPADQAACVRRGIPTLCLLGTNNYSVTKKNLLLALNVKKIVVFFDGDKPGYEATRKIVADLRDYVNISRVELPINKENPYDPANCPFEYYDRVKEALAKW